MPRVSEIDPDTIAEVLKDAIEKGSWKRSGAPTWEAVTAHCPNVLKGMVGLMNSFYADGTMPPRYIEIAIVTVSRINACRHCVGRHSTRLAETGLGHETIELILEDDVPSFNETDLLVRDYAKAVSTHSAQMRDRYFEALKERFSEPQIVELTWRIALAGAFNRFNNALQVDLDDRHLAVLLSQNGRAEALPPVPSNEVND